MPSKNPAINKRARDKWYSNNAALQILRQSEKRAELVKWMNDYKATLHCECCGMDFKDCQVYCDFHHPDPSKKDMTTREAIHSSKARLLKLLANCIPICANCHRKIHHM